MNNSDKTSKLIIKLSELMKYLLYETKVKRQSLEKEINCIENYLDIERLRHGNRLEIDMNISGSFTNKQIAPMLLMSFVENAFKHGVSKNIGKVKVNLNFKFLGEYLYFYIENPMPATPNFNSKFSEKSGIGLENVKKRLALGYDKDHYKLKIENSEDLFLVKLKINVEKN